MTEQPDPTQGRPFRTNEQDTRRDYALRDLESARAAELTDPGNAGLILIIERLRLRLDDMIQLVDEITEASPRPPE